MFDSRITHLYDLKCQEMHLKQRRLVLLAADTEEKMRLLNESTEKLEETEVCKHINVNGTPIPKCLDSVGSEYWLNECVLVHHIYPWHRYDHAQQHIDRDHAHLHRYQTQSTYALPCTVATTHNLNRALFWNLWNACVNQKSQAHTIKSQYDSINDPFSDRNVVENNIFKHLSEWLCH